MAFDFANKPCDFPCPSEFSVTRETAGVFMLFVNPVFSIKNNDFEQFGNINNFFGFQPPFASDDSLSDGMVAPVYPADLKWVKYRAVVVHILSEPSAGIICSNSAEIIDDAGWVPGSWQYDIGRQVQFYCVALFFISAFFKTVREQVLMDCGGVCHRYGVDAQVPSPVDFGNCLMIFLNVSVGYMSRLNRSKNNLHQISKAMLIFSIKKLLGSGHHHLESRDSGAPFKQVAQSDRMAAEAWGLSEQEYQRYQTLMEGPRGIWSPSLDPLTALGIAARSDAERQKYAEMLVRTERQRVEAELAFQRAYDAAWQQLYPSSMPVDPFTMKGGTDATQSFFGNRAETASSRLNVVVATQGCGQCDATIKRLLSNGAAMDIWVVDAEGDDGRIRDWAIELGIPPNQVRDGHITLNHGGSLSIDVTDLPRVAPRGAS